MGCLNNTGQFPHWFGNIHLSGPCNRSCYFCIGQHMMALDPLNVLDTWPLPGFDEFIRECRRQQVRDVNVTGTNTDPLLYRHLPVLVQALRSAMPHPIPIGVRTNGVYLTDDLRLFDKASVSLTTLDPDLYRRTMGTGVPPDIKEILQMVPRVKVNVVLCEETVHPYTGDLWETLWRLRNMGVRTVNLREPYGQPHIGDPIPFKGRVAGKLPPVFGMPRYLLWGGLEVIYWDVHYVEVESVNLYASGRVSLTYPVTLGHAPDGVVEDQSHFTHGRHRPQWVTP